MILKVLSKDDSELEMYKDIIKPYAGGYDARKVLYWILLVENKVIGIVVVREEPLQVIEPLGTIASVVLIIYYDKSKNELEWIASEALKIAKENH